MIKAILQILHCADIIPTRVIAVTILASMMTLIWLKVTKMANLICISLISEDTVVNFISMMTELRCWCPNRILKSYHFFSPVTRALQDLLSQPQTVRNIILDQLGIILHQ